MGGGSGGRNTTHVHEAQEENWDPTGGLVIPSKNIIKFPSTIPLVLRPQTIGCQLTPSGPTGPDRAGIDSTGQRSPENVHSASVCTISIK